MQTRAICIPRPMPTGELFIIDPPKIITPHIKLFMDIKTQIQNLLAQICALLESLANEQFSQPVKVLSDGTIGQHTRHIIEFYQELFKGYDQGVIDYDNRKRSHAIESDRLFAIQQLREISEKLAKANKELWLTADSCSLEESVETSLLRKGGSEKARIRTNYERELVYNLEHTVHHMALLRIAVSALSDLALPEGFGVALSTQKFRKACRS